MCLLAHVMETAGQDGCTLALDWELLALTTLPLSSGPNVLRTLGLLGDAAAWTGLLLLCSTVIILFSYL